MQVSKRQRLQPVPLVHTNHTVLTTIVVNVVHSLAHQVLADIDSEPYPSVLLRERNQRPISILKRMLQMAKKWQAIARIVDLNVQLILDEVVALLGNDVLSYSWKD